MLCLGLLGALRLIMAHHRVLIGDCLERLRELPPSSHQVCITSPPYWNLRDYRGEAKQIGLEESIEAHLDVLLRVFREVRRVLRPDATLWVNYGDKYESKELLGLPWRLALALQEDDWCLRSDIIWSKPNPVPEPLSRGRPVSSHEHLFLLSASPSYYYDADAVREGRNLRDVWEIPKFAVNAAHFATYPPALVEPCIKAGSSERGCCRECRAPYRRIVEVSGGTIGTGGWRNHDGSRYTKGNRITNQKAHDGTYSRETTGWEAGCGCDAGDPIPCKVLDPFGGALTTALVSDRLGRDSTSIELSAEYAAIGESRLRADAPLFLNLGIVK